MKANKRGRKRKRKNIFTAKGDNKEGRSKVSNLSEKKKKKRRRRSLQIDVDCCDVFGRRVRNEK